VSAPVLHATLVARRLQGCWAGVLVRGPSGAGKSDLALRLAATHSWRLVADDRVRLWRSGGEVYGAAPSRLAGLVEARGLGVVACPALPFAAVRLVVDAVPAGQAPERTPEAAWESLLETLLPRRVFSLLEGSATRKIELALEHAARGTV
jgi:serine kinase of HPr protein (carbohydrate metabolism regulator)